MISHATADGVGIFRQIDDDKALNAKLEGLRGGNWEQLQSMTRQELDGLYEEIRRTQHVGLFGDDVCALRGDAVLAIEAEVEKREALSRAHAQEQQHRKANIHKAANLVSQARDCCLYAAQVERTASYEQPPIEPPDVATMDDGELSRTLDGYRAELTHVGNLSEQASEQSSLIALLKTPEAKAVSLELKADADAYAKCRESLQAAAQAVSTEIERRAAERAAAESEREHVAVNLPDIVAELRERIAKLEKAD